MTVSIIIAVKNWQKNLEECVDKCAQLDYPPSGFEILILPDAAIERDSFHSGRVPLRIIPTGPVNPAQKRDIAIEYAKGEILGFLDDDAYPAKEWLNKAMDNFKDSNVAAVGGPAVTPGNDGLRQMAGGRVYSSAIVSAGFVYRYLPKYARYVDDYPSCNFLVRKSIMRQLGGFDTKFWPGEDTKLCLEITKKLGKSIIYDPQVMVYHHRRPLFARHLKQVAGYALHRGYFARRYPQTSRRLSYFIPTAFLFAVATGGILSIFLAPFKIIYLWSLSLYLLLVFIFAPLEILFTQARKEIFLTGFNLSKELTLIPLVFFGIILTHFSYGFYFLKGLLVKSLKEEK